MAVDLFRKRRPLFVGTYGMETASVKRKAKWCALNVALENVQHNKGTRGIGVCCFFVGLLYGDVRCINSDDGEALLGKPNCVVACAAADFQCPTGSDWCRRYCFNEVEIGLANVPRCRALFVHFPEVIFDVHSGASPLA